jgi:hypothetical protein
MAMSAMAILGGSGLAGTTTATTVQPEVSQSAQDARQQPAKPVRAGMTAKAMQAMFGSSFGSLHGWTYPRQGWSVAEGRRRARKARNVKRNKAAHRGHGRR